MEKVIAKKTLSSDQVEEDLKFWLSKTPSERLAAVDQLRKQYYGNSFRLQRVVNIIKLSQS